MTKLGLGTAAIGRPHYINIRNTTNAFSSDLATFRIRGMQMLEEAYKQGIRYFDTAPGYGMAEDLLIDWISRNQYPDVEIATKWGYTYVANFQPNATQHEVKEHSLAKLNEQWGQSEKLLPYLTTYQIHSATFETGVLENESVLNRLAELKSEHSLKIGLTSTGANQLELLKKALDVEVEGHLLFDTFQVTYNILEQSIAPVFQDSITNNKRFIIKEALANGRLFPNNHFQHYQELYSYLQTLSKKYEVGTDAIALRFCQDSISPFSILSGASEEKHLSSNLKVNNLQLKESELEKLFSFKTTNEAYWKERSKLAWN